ncbi:MAG TPA: hypothetical protein VI039_13620 [Solirubrobacterales bacterium]
MIRRFAPLLAAALVVLLAIPASASATLHNDFAESAADVSFTGKEWGEVFPANLSSASKESGEPNHAGFAGGHSVWTSWQIFDEATVQVKACGAKGADLLIAVYTGNAVNALTELASDNEENAAGCVTADFEAEAEGVYRIAVDAKSSPGTSPVTFRIAKYAANDDFANAVVLTELPTTEKVDTRLATSEAGEPAAAGSGNSVWYRWTPSENGVATVYNCDFWPSADYVVYTGGALEELSQVATGEGGGNTCASGEAAEFEAEEGTTYSIRVEGFPGKGYELQTGFGWTPEAPARKEAPSLLTPESGSTQLTSSAQASTVVAAKSHRKKPKCGKAKKGKKKAKASKRRRACKR